MTDTLVVIQAAADELSKSDLSAAGFGSQAASAAGGAYDILLLGPMASSLSSTAAGLGARTVFTMSSGELEAYTAEAYASAVEAFLEGRSWRLVAAATSSSTKEYFPRLAALLDVPMATEGGLYARGFCRQPAGYRRAGGAAGPGDLQGQRVRASRGGRRALRDP